MNRKQQSVVLAGLLALVLAGCSSTKTGAADEMSAGTSASGTGATSPAMPAPATAATETPMAMPGQTPGAQATMPTPGATPNAVVVSIEPMPRQGAGSTAVGGSTTGTTGSSMGEDKQYRITLRMDGGATRVVTQDKPPAFRSGDRVNVMDDGVINR
jgi:hypothetical protein